MTRRLNWLGEANLGKMHAQSVERRRALAGEQLAPPMARQRGLVVDRTHRARTACRDDLSPRRSPPRQSDRFCCGADEVAARELARNNNLATGVDGVDLKAPLRQVQTDPRDSRKIPDRLAHGRLPFRWGFDNDHLGTLMPCGARSTPSIARGAADGSNRTIADIRHRPTARVWPAQMRAEQY